jgi:hypothetical protein
MLFSNEPANELLVDPVWAGVPILTYITGWWTSYNPEGVFQFLTTVREYRLVDRVSGTSDLAELLNNPNCLYVNLLADNKVFYFALRLFLAANL